MCLSRDPDKLDAFIAMCERERCPYEVVGEATKRKNWYLVMVILTIHRLIYPWVLFGKPPKMLRDVKHHPSKNEFSIPAY